MAYLLNLFYHYKNPLLHLDQNVSLGIMECLDVLFPGDFSLQGKMLSEEFPKYFEKESTFGKQVAINACSMNDASFDKVSWWSIFGAITLNLQRLAMQILSLTSSSSGCKKNWSSFEGVTCAQEWIVDDVDDDVGHVGGHKAPTPKYRSLRELYDEDFESADEEIIENEVEV
ncbi:hypothetical protein C2S52_015683 [Perilla frutescens var. hirtella]|nr:hypothetical protein C2S52_015683 [Perilla frutescens var. hirtella]